MQLMVFRTRSSAEDLLRPHAFDPAPGPGDVSTTANRRVHSSPVIATATLAVAVLCCQGGCVATKYKLAKKNTPPVQVLGIAFPSSAPLQPTLAALVIYGGPGSWKREALWDEYVLAIQNSGKQAVTVDSATLTDSYGNAVAAGVDPWALEKQSKLLEKQYRTSGLAFVRTAGPAVLIVGAGATAAAATTASVFVSAAAVGAALAGIVILPVYYVSVWGINHHNKKAVVAEFTRRRLSLPLALAPGETRTGSMFFPMVRDPHSLDLHWSSETGTGQATLPLDFLHGLHVPATPAGAATR
jgi:hypothetical protein